ncbi:anaerobic ribonucleoside-triphosphate reductase activating protein [Dysgonomonas hofstadii]|uniref:Anaerobic ribonucleoside-triphosphate reductase activating protein n=1 Tax=Dysgonomonas hofstadii TaxID=637886 RepID=A0A840CJQ0_9BACT|nr:anaerobic ribonucleoside-triphosphate reductase activating protein [Dysgonomonas hofstadii]MBB4035596.1 anaerobic ribonucleoside-triphosphate reductase activating protein [Dysgonomonas hofstadii]
MLKYSNYNIVFQEIPGEVTLAVNLSNCPNRCKGCHSLYLQQDIGEVFDEYVLEHLLDKYGNSVTCICFMGGDIDPEEVERLSVFVREKSTGNIKTGWYSGRIKLPESVFIENFDYIKLGAYIERYGGLDNATTNQRFYKVESGKMIDQTFLFQQRKHSFFL